MTKLKSATILIFGLMTVLFSVLYPDHSLVIDKMPINIWRVIMFIPIMGILLFEKGKVTKQDYISAGFFLTACAGDIILSYNFAAGFLVFFIFNIYIGTMLTINRVMVKKRYLIVFIILGLMWQFMFNNDTTGILKYPFLIYIAALGYNIFMACNQEGELRNPTIIGALLFLAGDLIIAVSIFVVKIENLSMWNNIIYYPSIMLYALYISNKLTLKQNKEAA